MQLTLAQFLFMGLLMSDMNRLQFFGCRSFSGIITMVLLSNILGLSLAIAAPKPEAIQGKTGGSVESEVCGFVANTPSYTMSISERMDYMRMFVEANGGQPTLLIVGPKKDDSFCVLGDFKAGLKPEISGVWEPGDYRVFVGDRAGERHPFTLRISTDR